MKKQQKKVPDNVIVPELAKEDPTPEQQVIVLDRQIEELKKRRQEVIVLDRQIEELEKRRQEVIDSVDYGHINEFLSSVMNKWIIVGGWYDYDEQPFSIPAVPPRNYSIYKLVKAVRWEGGNSFRVSVKHIMRLTTEYGVLGDLDGNMYDVEDNHYIKDVHNLEVISPKKVRRIIEHVRKTINKRLDRAEKDAGQPATA